MSKILWYRVSAAVLLALLASAPVSGQPALTNDGFTENFDSMLQDGTLPPDGWTVYTIPGSNGVWTALTGIPVDQMSPEFFGTPSQGLSAVLYPSSTPRTNNNGFNAATDDAPDDRALTTSPTGVSGSVLELVLTNNTGRDLTSLSISYDIRRFTVGAGTSDTGNGPGADELPGYWLFYSLDGGATYTNVSDLNPDINSVPNTVGVTHMPMDVTAMPNYLIDLSSSPLTNGSMINFCWVDDNGIASSPDQIIGLDNVVITVPAP
jgi:hypothetical protein